ncbi:pre-rRNA-processing protein TSR4, partial [Lecanoromycetidae sp. Uapishka_2]
MAPDECDSSDENTRSFTTTNVLLGYASKEPTDDGFSHLGGYPTWLDDTSAPSAELARCKTCNSMMTLLLQLNGDLPEKFHGHERKFPGTSSQNPFATSKTSQSPNSNPFAAQSQSSTLSPFSSLASKPAQTPSSDLPTTFAEKARISSPPREPAAKEPWPPQSSLPSPYPAYYLDADYEALDPDPPSSSSKNGIDIDTEGSGSKDDDKDAFESTIDKTFQKFADRLAQNPEQVLRYEFGGVPLLYSKTDTVGRLISNHHSTLPASSKVTTKLYADGAARVLHCPNCSAPRVFELQLVPQAIAELEAEEEGLDGMEWGTIIMYVCAKDCGARGVKDGEVGWLEEWTGVQWEEDAKTGRN